MNQTMQMILQALIGASDQGQVRSPLLQLQGTAKDPYENASDRDAYRQQLLNNMDAQYEYGSANGKKYRRLKGVPNAPWELAPVGGSIQTTTTGTGGR